MNESALFCTTFCVLKLLVCPFLFLFVCLHVYPELDSARLYNTESAAEGHAGGDWLHELLSRVYVLAVG